MLQASQPMKQWPSFLPSSYLVDNENYTPLRNAICFQCSFAIALLAPLTTTGIGGAQVNMAIYQTELTPAVQDLLRRAALDQEAVTNSVRGGGVAYAAHYDASSMLKILTKDWKWNT